MANLAIKGHKTRGKELIEILEMLGGINLKKLEGTDHNYYYSIDNDGTILGIISVYNHICYTIEEFLEKYPHKVGDKVYYDNKVCDIIEMLWNNNLNTISYGIHNGKIKNLAIVGELQPYKEETMKERQYKELRMPLDDDDKLATDVTIDGDKILPPNGYLIGKITQVDNGMLVEYVKKQPQYPKTYEECCEVLGYEPDEDKINCYQGQLIESFVKLLICRDAYWRMAGKQMGLGKPWEPELNSMKHKFALSNVGGNISFEVYGEYNSILCFPTEEMRDAFFENFNDLIEKCKELL